MMRQIGKTGMMAVNAMAPVAIATKFRQTSRGQRVTHRELLKTFTGNSGEYTCLQIFVNPGLSSTYPWLASIAPAYQFYVINRITLEWSPSCPSSTTGKILLTEVQDVYDPPFGSMADQISYAKTQPDTIWTPASCSMGRSKNYTKRFLVRTGTPSAPAGTSVDLHFYDPIQFMIGFERVTNEQYAGEIYVNYDITFYTPVPAQIGGNVVSFFNSWVVPSGNLSTSFVGTAATPWPLQYSGPDNFGSWTNLVGSFQFNFAFPTGFEYAILRVTSDVFNSTSASLYASINGLNYINLNTAAANNLTLPGGGTPASTSIAINYDYSLFGANTASTNITTIVLMMIQVATSGPCALQFTQSSSNSNINTLKDFDMCLQFLTDTQALQLLTTTQPLVYGPHYAERKIVPCSRFQRTFQNAIITDGVVGMWGRSHVVPRRHAFELRQLHDVRDSKHASEEKEEVEDTEFDELRESVHLSRADAIALRKVLESPHSSSSASAGSSSNAPIRKSSSQK